MNISNDKSSTNNRLALFFLILAAILFGSTLIITKLGTQEMPIFVFNGVRHLIALLCYAPLYPKLKQLNKQIVIVAIITGVANYGLLTLQTIGLQTTTAAKGGFITSLYIVLTPVFGWIVYKDKFGWKKYFAIGIALIGVMILFLDTNTGEINIGDLIIFCAAISGALQILFTSKMMKGMDVYLFSLCQIIVVTLLLFISGIFAQQDFGIVLNASNNIWIELLYIGIAATFLPLLLQNYSQQFIDASHTALVFSLVPLSSALFGVLIGNEIIEWRLIIGGMLILIGILISSIKNGNKKPI